MSSEVARNFVGRADEIAAAVGKRSAELTRILDEKSSGLLAAIATKTNEFTSEVGRVTENRGAVDPVDRLRLHGER